jgi:hypothetical protein
MKWQIEFRGGGCLDVLELIVSLLEKILVELAS